MGNDVSVPKLSPEERVKYEQGRVFLTAYIEAENIPRDRQSTSDLGPPATVETTDEQLTEGLDGSSVDERDESDSATKVRNEQSSRQGGLVDHGAALKATATSKADSGMNGATTMSVRARDQARDTNGSNAQSRSHTMINASRESGEVPSDSEPLASTRQRVQKSTSNTSNPVGTGADSKGPASNKGGATTSMPHVTPSFGLASRKSSCASSESDTAPKSLHNPASTKRPSVSEGHLDLTGISAQKRQKTAPEAQSSGPESPQSSANHGEREPPEWYTKMAPNKTRDKDTANADILLARIKGYIREVKNSKSGALDKLRESLHEAPFLDMHSKGPKLVRNHRMLDNNYGLPQVFDPRYSGSADSPPDVQSDAQELYHKWCAKDFETDMLRGIIMSTSKADSIHGIAVANNYKQSYKYQGNGKLVNGQWWPLLPCAVRDGAHGEYVAGISGESGVGAYSCFISGGKDHIYKDVDKGDVVEYYGQDSKDPGKIARGTELMQLSYHNKIPVRFIRSSKANSEFAPQIGFRYDGLYDITGCELEDKVKQRYRFRLERIPGQGPIRGGNGPEARPTKQEVEHYQQDKRFRGSS